MLRFLLLGCFSIGFLVECNPVPIPGVTSLFPCVQQPMSYKQTSLHDYVGFNNRSCQGEGYCASTCTVEAEAWMKAFCKDPANGGQRPPMSLGSNDPDRPRTTVHKRSFMRACRRALIHGHSHYHGRYMRSQDFPATLRHKVQATQSSTTHKAPKSWHTTNNGRLTLLHWNPGGLSQATFVELKHWLKSHPVDIVTLAETRWSFFNVE